MGYQVIYRKAKPIVIDDQEFPSIRYAAAVLQVSTLDLYNALVAGKFRGKDIHYKNAWDVPDHIRELRPQQPTETLHYKPTSEKQASTKSNDMMLAAFNKANQEQKENKMTENKTNKKAEPIEIDGKRFNSIIDAARYYNVVPGTIATFLAKSKSRTYKGMPIKYVDDAKEAAVKAALNSSKPKTIRHKAKRIPVLVEGTEFESMTAAAKYLETSPANVTYALQTGRKIKGFKVEYKSEAAKDKVTTVDKRRIGKSITLTHKDTLQKYTFKSYNDAAAFIGVSARAITDALYNGRTHVKDYLLPNAIVEPEPIKAVELQVEQPVITPKAIVKEPETISGIQVAKNILKEKIMDYIKSDNFTVAKELITVVEQIKE